MIEAFIGAFFGAALGVVSGFYVAARAMKKAANTTGATIGFFEIYEN